MDILTKQKIMGEVLQNHQISEHVISLSDTEEKVLSYVKENTNWELIKISQKWRKLVSSPGKSIWIHRDKVAEGTGYSPSYVSRVFSSLRKKGRVFYIKQFGDVSYIPLPEELDMLQLIKN